MNYKEINTQRPNGPYFDNVTLFAFELEDQSMEPEILEGDILGVDIRDKEIQNGNVYYCYLEGQGRIFRKVYLETKKIILKPANPFFPILEVPRNEVPRNLIIGSMTWAMRFMDKGDISTFLSTEPDEWIEVPVYELDSREALTHEK